MATLAAIRAVGTGGPKFATTKEMRRWLAGRPSEGGGPGLRSGKTAGESTLSGLKNFGNVILDTLSVPQAVMFTTASKLGQAFTGKKGMDWSDYAGGFSDNYKGFREILEQAGVEKDSGWAKWGGLAGDIALDPMWALAPVKLTKTAGAAAKALDGAGDAARAGGTVAKALSKDAGTKAMLSKFASNTTDDAAEAVSKIKPGVVKRNHKVKVEAGAHPSFPLQPARAQGTLVDDRWFVVKTATGSKKKGSTPTYAIYELDDPKVITAAAEPISIKFTKSREAVKWIEKQTARSVDETIDPKFVTVSGPKGSSMATLDSRERAIAGVVRSSADRWKGTGSGKFSQKEGWGDLGIKIGFGRPVKGVEGGRGATGWNKTFNTKIPLPGRSLGTVNSGSSWSSFFQRDPLDRVGHRAYTAAKEQMEHIEATFGADAALLFPRVTEEQRRLVYMAAAAENASVHVEDAVDLGAMWKNALKSEGRWTHDMERMHNWGMDRLRQMGKKEGIVPNADRGRYMTQGMDDASITHMIENEVKHTSPFASTGPPAVVADKSRTMETAFSWFQSPDELADFLKTQAGLSDEVGARLADDLAQETQAYLNSDTVSKYFKNRPGAHQFRDDAGLDPLPEWMNIETDFVSLIGRREREHVRRITEKQLERLFVENKWMWEAPEMVTDAATGQKVIKEGGKNIRTFADPKYEAAWKRMHVRINTKNLSGVLSEHDKAQAFQNVMAHLKAFYTTFNIQHPVANTLGDAANVLPQGNWRHFLSPLKMPFFRPGGVKKGSRTYAKGQEWAEMATRNPEAFKKIYKLGDIEYTGAEIYTLSHMVGLGKGYIGADIARFVKMFDEASAGWKVGTRYYRMMQRYGMTRDDAVRLQTFFKHLQSGLDPFAAQFKTLDGIFDYGDLTDFEKIYLRNIIMFYTWMRKNMAFQVKASAMKPGLYSAYGDIERDREQLPFEPDYMKNMGLLPIPGVVGGLSVFAPWGDLYKLEPSADSFRKNVMSALAPPFKQAIELGTNRNLFTGGDLEAYEGQNKSSSFPAVDRVLNMLNIGQPTRPREGEALKPAIPVKLQYLLGQLGPVSGQSGKLFDENPNTGWLESIAAITGFPRIHRPNPDWERQRAVGAAKRKADETRKRNASK
jgi:hypothetical protein